MIRSRPDRQAKPAWLARPAWLAWPSWPTLLSRPTWPTWPTCTAWLKALAAALLATAFAGPPCAAAETNPDPPARVGRVSLVVGTVDVIVDAAVGWVPASVNMPVTSRTALRTDLQSRAEIRFGANSLQLNANTQITVSLLSDDAFVLAVQRGNVALQGRPVPGAAGAAERLEFSAGEVRGNFTAPVSAHVAHAPIPGRVDLRLFEGTGELTAPAPLALVAGQQTRVDSRSGAVVAQGEAERTRFDEWAAQRARRLDGPVAAAPYLSREMTGAEVLDEHGSWRVDPRFGPVWTPRGVDVAWAPYRYGRWLWVSPWGWTWVDDAPWGFAPFHYGRWVFLGGRWGWLPGSPQARPVYAPALVGFYAGLSEVVGWFPLGPGEPYRPGFVASARWTQGVNAAMSTQPATTVAHYRYAQTSFAASALAPEAFGAGASAVAAARVALSPVALSAAAVHETHSAPTPGPAVGPQGSAAGTPAPRAQVPQAQLLQAQPPHAPATPLPAPAAAAQREPAAAQALQAPRAHPIRRQQQPHPPVQQGKPGTLR